MRMCQSMSWWGGGGSRGSQSVVVWLGTKNIMYMLRKQKEEGTKVYEIMLICIVMISRINVKNIN